MHPEQRDGILAEPVGLGAEIVHEAADVPHGLNPLLRPEAGTGRLAGREAGEAARPIWGGVCLGGARAPGAAYGVSSGPFETSRLVCEEPGRGACPKSDIQVFIGRSGEKRSASASTRFSMWAMTAA